MSEAIDEVLPDALAGERLDRVVAMMADCSRSMAANLIVQGHVTIDGRPVTQRSLKVEGGVRVKFIRPEIQGLAPRPDPGVEFRVVHVDDDVIVIDKPVGLVVHPGAGRPDSTLVNGLLARFPEIAGVGQPERPGIVHRLDAETSGLLVVARTPAAHETLTGALAAHDVERRYLAVVTGVVQDDRGVVDAPIGRSTQRRTRMTVTADGRPARTHYQVLHRALDQDATVVRCELETGRTHQIRVHLGAIGHPVLGDSTYGGAKVSGRFGRVALHAAQLGFAHPSTDEPVSFTALAPSDLAELLDGLGHSGRVDS